MLAILLTNGVLKLSDIFKIFKEEHSAKRNSISLTKEISKLFKIKDSNLEHP